MLEQFRETPITWDKASRKVYEPLRASAGDNKGRKLSVQVVNDGVIEDLSGASLSLYWETKDKAHKGLDAFETVNAEKGEFEIYYTTGMLSNEGTLNANLVLVEANGRIVSEPFTITVFKGIDDDAIQSSDSFTALTEALAQVATINNKADRDELLALESTFEQNKVSVEQQLAQTKRKIPEHLLDKVKRLVPNPEGFTWEAPIQVYQSANGTFTTDLDVASFAKWGNGKTYYVDVNNGSNDNDGLSPDTALKSIYVARAKSDVDVIEVAEGFYTDEAGFNGNSLGEAGYKNLVIRAAPGADVIITTARYLNWTKDTTTENVYRQRRTLIQSIYDKSKIDENGDYLALKKVDSINEVDSTPNSYFYDGDLILVHTFDSRPADNDIITFLNIKNFHVGGDYTVYFDNLKIYGGNDGAVNLTATTSTGSPLFLAKGCEFKYATGGNGGLTSLGYDSLSVGCTAAQNHTDGFNYHVRSGRLPKAIEVDCVGRHNGKVESSYQDNGSTMHDGGTIIRISCDYHDNRGPNCHDVSAGTQSWNLGCQAHKSVATLITRVAGFQIENGEMWLDTCVAYDSPMAYRVPNGKLNLRNSLFEGEESVINTGVVNEY